MKNTSKGFDRLAGIYDFLMKLVFGNSITKSQTYFLHLIPPNTQILIMGGGTGWILNKVFERVPDAMVDYVEISPKMMARSQKKLNSTFINQVNFICEDALDYVPKKKYDVILTFFFLDLFSVEKATEIVVKSASFLKSNGLWLYADFSATPPLFSLKRGFINLMYHICNVVCVIEGKSYWSYDSVFDGKQWQEKASRFFFFGMISAKAFRKIQI